MADNTRLRILKLLRGDPLTQVEIARKLRLRPPTISHHIKSLRVAGLISYLKSEHDEMRYSTRPVKVRETCKAICDFLDIKD